MSKNSEIDFQLIEEEMIKCKDPVYFYERYCGVKQHSGVLEYPQIRQHEDTKTDTKPKG
jgi:hypothetical protein